MEKRRNCSSGAISPFFHNNFNISNFRSHNTYSFVKCAVRLFVFLISANLICRGTDISKCFRESLGIRDNESRLYSYDFDAGSKGPIGVHYPHMPGRNILSCFIQHIVQPLSMAASFGQYEIGCCRNVGVVKRLNTQLNRYVGNHTRRWLIYSNDL